MDSVNNINYGAPGSGEGRDPLPSDSNFNQAMQNDIEERKLTYQIELAKQLNKQKEKVKKYKKKLEKAQNANVNYQQKIKALLEEREALLEKNKQLGWLILKEKSESGDKFSEVALPRKTKGSIMGLLEADITDYLLERQNYGK